jgi:hypothetical protein
MKRFNLGLLAFVLGGAMALTQSSFRAAHTETLWGYVQSSGTFVDLTGKVEDDSAHPAAGTYSCISSSNICKGFDATMPSSTSDLDNTSPGDFRQN